MTDGSVSTTPPDSRRRRLPEERPAQIIAAALEVFGEQGLAGARLDDIARRAGLSKGTIYLYFDGKEALFRAVVQATLLDRLEFAERTFGGESSSAADALRGLLRSYWGNIRQPEFGTVHRLVHSELHRFPELAAFFSDAVIRRAHGLIASIIRRGIARGEFRAVDPLAATRMLVGTLIAHAQWRGRTAIPVAGLPTDDETILAQIEDWIFAALRPDA